MLTINVSVFGYVQKIFHFSVVLYGVKVLYNIFDHQFNNLTINIMYLLLQFKKLI